MAWCEYCDKNINKSYISRHINSFTHRANLRKSTIKPKIIVSPIDNYNKEVDPIVKEHDLYVSTNYSNYVRVAYNKLFTSDEPASISEEEPQHERALTLMKNISEEITRSYYQWITKQTAMKIQISVEVIYKKEMTDPSSWTHTSPMNIITSVENIESTVYNCIADVSDKMIELELRGSVWIIDYVKNVTLKLSKYKIPMASSYIELPPKLRNSYLVNIKNDDNFCFLWCVVAYLHPATFHKDRVSNYAPYFD